jgi:hypothetical protein
MAKDDLGFISREHTLLPCILNPLSIKWTNKKGSKNPEKLMIASVQLAVSTPPETETETVYHDGPSTGV